MAKILGDLNEKTGGNGSSGSTGEQSKKMDDWNNKIGRQYGKKAKTKEELLKLLSGAYPGYHVAMINEIATPVSNPDLVRENNLG